MTDAAREQNAFEPFKLRHAIQLAAPHTWPASVMPVLVACALARHETGAMDPIMAFVLLAICVLMQSSVNAFNDYFDFVKGTDSAADELEADDSTLVNDGVDPRSALILASCLLACAFGLGIWIIWRCGVVPLLIALVGAAAVVLYSAGRTPISSLPLGEAVSGCVMGGLIPLACFFCLTGRLSAFALACSLPCIIGVALIMMTNNACDIEKDETAGRRTLPVLLGRERTRTVYRSLIILWLAALCALCGLFFQNGAIWLPFMLLASIPLVKALWKNPLVQPSRIAAMGGIVSLNVALGAFYALCIMS